MKALPADKLENTYLLHAKMFCTIAEVWVDCTLPENMQDV